MTTALLLGIAFILTHELDAMSAAEWRMFPGLSHLSERWGRDLFVGLHIPMFFVLFWGLTGAAAEQWAWGFDVFLIFHVVVHALLHRHPQNGFRNALSWVWIGGAGVCGVVDLILR